MWTELAGFLLIVAALVVVGWWLAHQHGKAPRGPTGPGRTRPAGEDGPQDPRA